MSSGKTSNYGKYTALPGALRWQSSSSWQLCCAVVLPKFNAVERAGARGAHRRSRVLVLFRPIGVLLELYFSSLYILATPAESAESGEAT